MNPPMPGDDQEDERPIGGHGYRWTNARRIRYMIASDLFHRVMDGIGSDDPALEATAWQRIDKELAAAKLTREDL